MQHVVQALSSIRQPNSSPTHINIPFMKVKSKTIYIPVYLRILTKSIKSINFQFLQASLNMTILLNTNTWGLPQFVRDYIAHNIHLSFNRNQKLKLQINEVYNIGPKQFANMLKLLYSKQYLKQHPQCINKKLQQVKDKTKIRIGQKYLARLSRNAKIEPYLLFTPFQLIDLVVSIEVQKLKIVDPQTGEQYKILFNIMKRQKLQHEDCTQQQIMGKMIQATYFGYFGQYQIATKRLIVQYTSQAAAKTLMKLGKNFYNLPAFDHKREKIKKQIITKDELPIKYAHFHIPLTKNPITVLTTQLIPLLLFSVINLSIYTQGPSLGGRISAIATIMLAFISLIPSFRQSIPVNPTFTVFQFLVYMQSFTSLLCLLQSIFVQDESEDNINEYMQNYSPINDYLWLITLCVTIIIIVLPLFMYIFYLLYFNKNNFLSEKKNLRNDKTFQYWNGCEQGNKKFLKQQILNDIVFAHQQKFNIFCNLTKINELLKTKSQTKIVFKPKIKKQLGRHMSLEEVNEILKNSSCRLKRKKATSIQKKEISIEQQIKQQQVKHEQGQFFSIYDEIMKGGLHLHFTHKPQPIQQIHENLIMTQSKIISSHSIQINSPIKIKQQRIIENIEQSQIANEGKISKPSQIQQSLSQVKKQDCQQDNTKIRNPSNQTVKDSLQLNLSKLKMQNQLNNERYVMSQRKMQMSQKQTDTTSRTETFLSARKYINNNSGQIIINKTPIVRRVIGRRVEILDRKLL